jgi:hypothetical protein
MENKGIDVRESVCVDSSHSAGNPVKDDLVGGDVGIYSETAWGIIEFPIRVLLTPNIFPSTCRDGL